MTNTPDRKPDDDEVDVYGLTHPGKVRAENQDHFLVATLHKQMTVLQSSLGASELRPFGPQRLAFLAMVADGVGGGIGGAEASAVTLETASEYILSSIKSYEGNTSDETGFLHTLEDAALRAHAAVRERRSAHDEPGTMATTLTLWMGVWPWYYLLQVGDSRYYLYRDGKLSQLTRDQTMAQDLVDQGVWTRAVGERSRFANVLSSSIGGEVTIPVVTRLRADWNNVHLICSDGLYKHVSDEQIAARLSASGSAREIAERLLQDALDGGGTDNITIIVGWVRPKR